MRTYNDLKEDDFLIADEMFLQGKSINSIRHKLDITRHCADKLHNDLKNKYPEEAQRRDKRFFNTLTNEDWIEIEKLYKEGVYIEDIAKKYNKSESKMCEVLKKKFPDVVRGKKRSCQMTRNISDADWVDIEDLYSSGVLVKDIALKYNVNPQSLGKAIAQRGLHVNTKEYRLIKTSIGNLQFNKKEDWLSIYSDYVNGKSLKQLCRELKVNITTLESVFSFHNLERVSKEEERRRCIENTNKAMLEKYGYAFPFQNPEVIQKAKETLVKNYGVDNPALISDFSERSKKTCMGKYGVPFYAQTQEMKDKAKETCRKKYGTEYYTQTNEYKERYESTCLDKYGVKHHTKLESVKKKTQKTNLERYGATSHMKTKEYKQKFHDMEMKKHKNRVLSRIDSNLVEFVDEYRGLRDKRENYTIMYNFRCKKCGHIFQGSMHSNMLCPICFPNSTKPELDLLEYIKSKYSGEIKTHFRLDKREIDIYLPELKIGFEYNGIYWHSLLVNDRITKNYHRDKTELFNRHGIKVYHIWSYYDTEKIYRKIDSILGINSRVYARNTECKAVSKKDSQDFFDRYHLDNSTLNKFSLGLYKDNELISCISFRAHKEGLEIARFATKHGLTVVGGFSKLLRHAEQYIKDNYETRTIITFCDRDWTADFNDSVYLKNGFTFVGDSGPILKYYDLGSNKIIPRQKLQRHKLKKLYGGEFEDSMSTNEFLLTKHIVASYNSGNWKFMKQLW